MKMYAVYAPTSEDPWLLMRNDPRGNLTISKAIGTGEWVKEVDINFSDGIEELMKEIVSLATNPPIFDISVVKSVHLNEFLASANFLAGDDKTINACSDTVRGALQRLREELQDRFAPFSLDEAREIIRRQEERIKYLEEHYAS